MNLMMFLMTKLLFNYIQWRMKSHARVIQKAHTEALKQKKRPNKSGNRYMKSYAKFYFYERLLNLLRVTVEKKITADSDREKNRNERT
jgi:hypothetical protein